MRPYSSGCETGRDRPAEAGRGDRPRARSALAAVLGSGIGLALGAVVGPVAAQSARAGSMALPPILDRGREVALARSAAPATVSADATVLVLERGTGYVVAEEGTNGVTCFVDRSWRASLEPMCLDREGSETILRLRLRFAELREAGATWADVERDREAGIRSGRYRLPSRPALTWMMSAGQVLYDDEGEHVGAWRPHLMIYYPHMTAIELGLAGGRYRHGPFLSDDGEATATLIIPMPEFIPVAERTAPDPGGGGG